MSILTSEHLRTPLNSNQYQQNTLFFPVEDTYRYMFIHFVKEVHTNSTHYSLNNGAIM